mmetsp:Transcript_1076/g.1912  ORF Transcript_1076/g.1912 Transcript_1076/m.1912 type:complete len:211 (+) Transcript_1076:426-1058(+)
MQLAAHQRQHRDALLLAAALVQPHACVRVDLVSVDLAGGVVAHQLQIQRAVEVLLHALLPASVQVLQQRLALEHVGVVRPPRDPFQARLRVLLLREPLAEVGQVVLDGVEPVLRVQVLALGRLILRADGARGAARLRLRLGELYLGVADLGDALYGLREAGLGDGAVDDRQILCQLMLQHLQLPGLLIGLARPADHGELCCFARRRGAEH